jgi:hypothetical protein
MRAFEQNVIKSQSAAGLHAAVRRAKWCTKRVSEWERDNDLCLFLHRFLRRRSYANSSCRKGSSRLGLGHAHLLSFTLGRRKFGLVTRFFLVDVRVVPRRPVSVLDSEPSPPIRTPSRGDVSQRHLSPAGASMTAMWYWIRIQHLQSAKKVLGSAVWPEQLVRAISFLIAPQFATQTTCFDHPNHLHPPIICITSRTETEVADPKSVRIGHSLAHSIPRESADEATTSSSSWPEHAPRSHRRGYLLRRRRLC